VPLTTRIDAKRPRRPSDSRRRAFAALVLGSALVVLELRLRGEREIDTQVVGQLSAFALFLPAALLCWRGLAAGRAGIVLVLLVAVALRAAAFQPATAPLLSTDLARYAWDARVQAHGINPYRYTPLDRRLRPLRDDTIWPRINLPAWHTIYPPGAEASFLGARTIFGGGLRATTWLFLVAEAATVALLLLALRRLRAPPERVALYAWHPLAVSEIAGNGHVDALVALAVAALLVAWQARRFSLAGVAVACGALVKFAPALLLAPLARNGRLRFLLPALVLVPLAYAPYLSVGGAVLGSLTRLDRELSFGSLAPPLMELVGRTWTHVVLGSAFALVVGVVALREHDSVERVARSTLLVLGSLLLVQDYLQPWYALALLPLLAIAAAPGWLWLTGALPLLYLFADGRLPVWVRPALFGPLAAAALLSLARGRRRAIAALDPLPERPRVAAVVPALNEVEALPGLLAELPNALLDEIVVVDGGSADGTVAAAERAGARVVVEPRRGYGRACAAGAAATEADLIVFLDGDGSDDPAYLPELLAPLLECRAALALGARVQLEAGALLAHQRLGNGLVAALVRLAYGVKVRDIPPLRAVRRDALERLALREMTYGWPTEMIVKAARAGLPMVEVPVGSRRRRGGTSKIAGRLWPSARAGARMLAVVARHA
jgi:hypothetical protein